jgi:hypothetical protein
MGITGDTSKIARDVARASDVGPQYRPYPIAAPELCMNNAAAKMKHN